MVTFITSFWNDSHSVILCYGHSLTAFIFAYVIKNPQHFCFNIVYIKHIRWYICYLCLYIIKWYTVLYSLFK